MMMQIIINYVFVILNRYNVLLPTHRLFHLHQHSILVYTRDTDDVNGPRKFSLSYHPYV